MVASPTHMSGMLIYLYERQQGWRQWRARAFDTVYYKLFINKLMKYGMKGKEIEWFKSYLSGGKQFCTVNGHKSRIEEVICDIPQGSCLGPLLFIAYLDDFLE